MEVLYKLAASLALISFIGWLIVTGLHLNLLFSREEESKNYNYYKDLKTWLLELVILFLVLMILFNRSGSGESESKIVELNSKEKTEFNNLKQKISQIQRIAGCNPPSDPSIGAVGVEPIRNPFLRDVESRNRGKKDCARIIKTYNDQNREQKIANDIFRYKPS